MATVYNFSAIEFTSGFKLEVFSQDVNESSIGALLVSITVTPPRSPLQVEVLFSTNLTAPQEATLTNIVATHDPTLDPRPGERVQDLQLRPPSIDDVGRTVWARDQIKTSESTGNGTGAPVYFDGTNWRRFSDDALMTN